MAGLLGVAFGIPVKEFSFGNTEILAGVITACAGMIMLALWVAVRELKRAMQPLGPGVAATPARAVFPQPAASSAPHEYASGHDDLMFNQPGAIRPDDAEPAAASPSAPLPWHEETASRDRGRNETPPALPTSPAEPAPKQRRNLLFSSTSRKERERAEGRNADPAAADPRPAPAAPPLPPKPSETPPATFEDAWPQPERPRSVDVSRRSRTPPLPSAEGDAAGADHSPVARNEEPPQVTVLKSGVVDGMAYSLYSDGSIEAQMPEGMMRFASIDELRTHLDQRT
ncbi:MAG: DUF308 domain-containing protein [Bradyrhizobium sp.]